MLLLLAILVTAVVTPIHRLLLACAPSNILISHVRASRPALRASAAMLTASVLLVGIAHAVSVAIQNGAPRWLNLLVLILLWDTIKFALVAVQSTVRRLARTNPRATSQHPAQSLE